MSDDVDFDAIADELVEVDVERERVVPRIVVPEVRHEYQDTIAHEYDVLRQGVRSAGLPDEFYQLLETRLKRLEAINNEVAQVGNPRSAAGQRLGGTAILTSDVTVVSQPVVRWQGKDEETGPVVITAGPVTPIAVSGEIVRPFLYVKWGTFGASFEAEVDIGTGRQFVVNASMVEVDVALDALAASNVAQANLGANLSFKALARTAHLIRTKYIDDLAQNASVLVTPPPFSVGLLPVQMSDVAGQIQVDFYDSSNTIRYTLLINNGSQVTPIPLSGDIAKIVVTNKTVNTQQVRLPFQLSI